MDWYRFQLSFLWPFSPGWDAQLYVPWDRKRQTARYRTPDGAPYDNPMGNVHHRTETMAGFGDWTWLVTRRGNDWFRDDDFWNLGFGTTIPIGGTERNPYRLGDMGLRHRHIQFGTGTVDPVLTAGYGIERGRWRWSADAGWVASLYENPKRYRGPPVADLAAGPAFRATEAVEASLHYTVTYQGRARWDSATDINSGYVQQGLQLQVPVRLGDWTVTPALFRSLEIDTWEEGDTFKMDWMYGLTIARAF